MSRMKRVTAGMLLSVLLVMQGIMAHASEGGCEHNWRMDRMEQVYAKEEKCGEHGVYCKVYIRGYNVVEVCTKCNDRKNSHYTEEDHRYLSR